MKQKEAEHESFESKHSDYTNPHMPSKTFKPPPPPQQKSFSEIYSINDPNILITNQQQVEQEIHNFYEELYKKVPNEKNLKDFLNFPMKQVTKEENEEIIKPVQEKEIASFIKSLNPQKAPGITGNSTAFYTVFWVKIRSLVTNAVNSILEKTKKLPNRQNIGIITLIPKQDKD